MSGFVSTVSAPPVELHLRDFLDKLCDHSFPPDVQKWYNVDVRSILGDVLIESHDVDPDTGSSLLFCPKSAIYCDPSTTVVHHFPRHLIHCFVDDLRHSPDPSDPNSIFRIEMFSVSPRNEQLSWHRCTERVEDIPGLQAQASRWLDWLNR